VNQRAPRTPRVQQDTAAWPHSRRVPGCRLRHRRRRRTYLVDGGRPATSRVGGLQRGCTSMRCYFRAGGRWPSRRFAFRDEAGWLRGECAPPPPQRGMVGERLRRIVGTAGAAGTSPTWVRGRGARGGARRTARQGRGRLTVRRLRRGEIEGEVVVAVRGGGCRVSLRTDARMPGDDVALEHEEHQQHRMLWRFNGGDHTEREMLATAGRAPREGCL